MWQISHRKVRERDARGEQKLDAIFHIETNL